MQTAVSWKKELTKVIATYLVILIIPITISFYAYSFSYKKLEANAIEVCRQNLHDSVQMLEQRMDEIYSITYQAYRQSQVQSFSYETGSFEGTLPSKLFKLQSTLPDFALTNQFMLDYFLFFPQTEIVMNHRFIYTYHDFYNNLLHYEDLSYDEWLFQTHDFQQRTKYLPNQMVRMNGLFAGQVLPIYRNVISVMYAHSSTDNHRVAVMAIIPETELEKLLTPLISQEGEALYVLGEGGEVLLGLHPDPGQLEYLATFDKSGQESVFVREIDGAKMLVTCRYSEPLRWQFVSIRPYSQMMQDTQQFFMLITGVVIASIVAGFLGTVFLTTQKKMPMRSLVEKTRILQEEKLQQLPAIRQSFFERVFADSLTKDEIGNIAGYLNLSPQVQYYTILLQLYQPSVREEDGLDQIHQLIVEGLSDDNPVVHNIGRSRWLLLLHKEWYAWADLLAELNTLTQSLHLQTESNVAVVVHPKAGTIIDLAERMQCNQESLNYKDYSLPHQVLEAKEIVDLQSPPKDIDRMVSRLNGAIRSGNVDATRAIFAEIREGILHNGANTSASYYQLLALLSHLNTLLADYMKENPQPANTVAALSAGIFQDLPTDTLYTMECLGVEAADWFALEGEKEKTQLMARVVSYVDENYANPQLSLTMVAEHFRISEPYLSSRFKLHTGENYSVYVENQKLERAGALLKDTDLPVTKIAEMVGYNSPNTFRKAFRKKYEFSPSDLRNDRNIFPKS